MATKAKSGSNIGTIVLVVILIAIGGIALSRIQADDDVTEVVTFKIEFEPGVRMDRPLHVQADAEGVEIINELVNRSPAVWDITLPKGADVHLYAQQPTDGQVTCSIIINGKIVDMKIRTAKGQIACHRAALPPKK